MKPKDPATIRKAIESIDQLIKLELEKIETMRELKRSLALALIDPTVWDGGKVRTSANGLSYSMLSGGDYAGPKSVFVIHKENGQDVEVSLWDVPLILWPKGIAEATRRSPLRDKFKRLEEAQTIAH